MAIPKISNELPEQLARQRAADLIQLAEILDRFDKLPVLDDRSPDGIIGYDENGLLG
jgi:hypothetical protein